MNPSASTPILAVENVAKNFGSHEVLRSINLTIQKGQVISILGRSGGGKSVFLKCLAGVELPTSGRILFEGAEIQTQAAKDRRNFSQKCSFLFQNNALFDSLTALENVALPLEQTTDLPQKEIRQRSLEALGQLELDSYAQMYPSQLSGGMQKRLALARALVSRPELVLFDEPTAGLDPIRRNAVFSMMVKYQRQFGFTSVLVTHDVQEALVISDQVSLLDAGTLAFTGSPRDFLSSELLTVRDFRDSTEALRKEISRLHL